MIKKILSIAIVYALLFLSSNAIAAVVEGRYYWELVFSYDNSKNDGPIVHKVSITKQKSIDAKEFLSSKFNIKSSFTYDNKVSSGIEFKGVKVGGNTSYQFHIELAKELVKTSESKQSSSETAVEERTYTISGGGKLDLYRLVYESNGMTQKTNIVSTTPKKEIKVELEFSVHNRILGLSEISDVLMSTHPGCDNRVEWAAIRNQIVSSSHKSDYDRFSDLVHKLKGITPGRDNKVEWANIRNTCNEIIRDWQTSDKQLLFNKLLNRFVATVPGSDNKVEWARIRSTSSNILSGIKKII